VTASVPEEDLQNQVTIVGLSEVQNHASSPTLTELKGCVDLIKLTK